MPYIAQSNGRQGLLITAADGSTALVYQQGAHVASWKPAGHTEVMYLSPLAIFKDGTALRGGVPIIWPQFSDMGSGPTHGIARNRNWDIAEEGSGFAVFLLKVRPGDSVTHDANIDLFYRVDVSATELRLSLKARNLGDKAFTFTTALHTYFAVSSIDKVSMHGLDEVSYADNLQKRQVCPPAEVRTIDKEVDRIYFDVKNPVVIADHGANRNIVVSGSGLSDVVLWNPWTEKAKKMSDLPPEGFRDYVCVEHGQIKEPFTLAPGATWDAAQIVAVKPLHSKI